MTASAHQRLLSAIRSRKNKTADFETGIITADRYVATLEQCVGSSLCQRYADASLSFSDSMKKAAGILTYNNPDMVSEEIYQDVKSALSKISPRDEIVVPKNALMVFRHVLTTPRKDRDGDILRTAGARPDPKMLLLWQHVHTMPIGKMLGVVHHDSKRLEVISAIVDINEVAQDAAVMVDNGMGRFSHGFKALSYVDLKEAAGGTTGKTGFDVKEFEIMEESLVSVPANVDATTSEILLDLIEGDKLTSSMMKAYGRTLRASRSSVSSSGGWTDAAGKKCGGKTNCGCSCGEGTAETAPGSPEKASRHDSTDAESEGEKAESDKMMCPHCQIPLEDGICRECGYVREDEDEDEEGAETEKPKKSKKGYVSSGSGSNLSGSFEEIQSLLRSKGEKYFSDQGILPSVNLSTNQTNDFRYVHLYNTFPSHAIFEVVVVKSGIRSEKMYKVGWTYSGDSLELIGDAEEVAIEVETRLRKKSLPGDSALKAGRSISASNRAKLESVYEGMGEIKSQCSTQTGRKMCDRHRIVLKEVITSGVDDFEVPKGSGSTIEQFSDLMSKCTASDLQKMARAVNAFNAVSGSKKSPSLFRFMSKK